MTKVREVAVSGFSADPNPNVTAPAAANLFSVDNAPTDQEMDERVEGVRWCIRFVDNSNVEVPTASADFQLWEKDDGASDTVGNGGLGRDAYISLAKETAAPSSQSYACTWKGKLFVQLIQLNTTGSATKAQVWMGTSTSVPG
jgi:hypothetical protein